jgi:hypothetical protein
MTQLQLTPDNLCETPVDGLIQFPALFYSNFAYFFVGFMILYWLWKRKSDTIYAILMGISTMFIGFFSSVYHFAPSPDILFLDLLGIACLMASLHFISLSKDSKTLLFVRVMISVSLLVLISLVAAFFSNFLAFILVLIAYAVFLLRELFPLTKNPYLLHQYRFLLGAIGLQILGIIFSMMERFDIFCNPHNHLIQGHAIWHVSTALSIYLVFLYFESCSRSHPEKEIPQIFFFFVSKYGITK